MCRWIETVRIEGGEAVNLPLHQARLERTLCDLTSAKSMPRLTEMPVMRSLPRSGIMKLHADYDASGIIATDLQPYIPRSIRSLRLVERDGIAYRYKSADRSALLEALSSRGCADEVIIVRRGLLTDTSYSNIALCDGRHWFTPASPLLRGTMRASLLASGAICEADITPADLKHFTLISLINAMLPLGRLTLRVSSIIY